MNNIEPINIAIIGFSGKYSKSDSTELLWNNLVKNIDLSETDSNTGHNYVNRFFTLDNIDLFDNEYFGYTAYEAEIADPQHRILLKCAKEALEHAGYAKELPGDKIGVFACSSTNTYLSQNLYKNSTYQKDIGSYSLLMANDPNFIATKISYKLNLTGPALSIQAACSSSLIAINYACLSLLNNECSMALVGGISIQLPHGVGYNYQEGGILSADGICRPFDSEANGTIRGNGCSVIVIKKLDAAIKDSNTIYSVIKSVAINNDGANKIGYTAPSLSGESAVIKDALSRAQMSINDIDYIESHGTGTALGDPIEIKSLAAVFNESKRQIPIGSIKANIGHLDVAAGLTSVIKSTYILNKNLIPALRNFKTTNPLIEGIAHSFIFPTENILSNVQNIGISSFGIGGTNTHLILGRFFNIKPSDRAILPYYLIPIYLFRKHDLPAYINNILKVINRNDMDFSDFAYSMSTGTKYSKNVLHIVANSKENFISQLMALTEESFEKSSPIELPMFNLADYTCLASTIPAFSKICKETLLASRDVTISIENYSVCFDKFLTTLKAGTGSKISASELITYESDLHPLEKFYQLIAKYNLRNEVNFNYLYSGLSWQRVSLPEYPLCETRFWVVAEDAAKISPSLNENSENELTVKSVEEKITTIVKDHLKINSPSTHESFFNANTDSLTVLELIDKISHKFSVKLTYSDLLSNPTPGKLASLICDKLSITENKVITLLRKSSNQKTIFLIHPAGGNMFCFANLNQYLTGDYNLYAIDMPDNYKNYESMEKLGAYYLTKIKEIQPEGPYILGGYSYGGNMAYEVSAQLESLDENAVEYVIMFDAWAPSVYNQYQGEFIDYQQIMPDVLSHFFTNQAIGANTAKLFHNKSIQEIFEIMREKNLVDSRLGTNYLVDLYYKWTFNHNQLKYHAPTKKIKANLVYFSATEDEDQSILNKLKMHPVTHYAWKMYFNNLTTIDVPGTHYSIFGNLTHLKALAKLFDKTINDFHILV